MDNDVNNSRPNIDNNDYLCSIATIQTLLYGAACFLSRLYPWLYPRKELYIPIVDKMHCLRAYALSGIRTHNTDYESRTRTATQQCSTHNKSYVCPRSIPSRVGGGGGHCHWRSYQMRANHPEKTTLWP